MRISDWSSDVCSSDLHVSKTGQNAGEIAAGLALDADRHDDVVEVLDLGAVAEIFQRLVHLQPVGHLVDGDAELGAHGVAHLPRHQGHGRIDGMAGLQAAHHDVERSEEHTSELQSLMRSSYAVFCLKKQKNNSY